MPLIQDPQSRQLVETAPASDTKKGGLAAIVGATAAALLYVIVPQSEGTKYVGYLDMVGIPTKCTGDTHGVIVGHHYTDAECRASLDKQLTLHAQPVMDCTPGLADIGHDNQRAAAVSLAYNIGDGAYCRSSVRRLFNAGNYRAACDTFLVWNRAGGKPVAGLTARRQRERTLCLKDVS
jgi:lysozyme